jgi:cell division protein FtsA
VLNLVREGVFLAGGCARIPEIQRLANRIFGLPVFLAKTSSISGLKSALDQPEFATGIGLARYGSFEWKKRQNQKGLSSGLKNTISQIFRFAGNNS